MRVTGTPNDFRAAGCSTWRSQRASATALRHDSANGCAATVVASIMTALRNAQPSPDSRSGSGV